MVVAKNLISTTAHNRQKNLVCDKPTTGKTIETSPNKLPLHYTALHCTALGGTEEQDVNMLDHLKGTLPQNILFLKIVK